MSESAVIRRWLHSVLNSLASGGAYHGVAPVSASYPFIVYQMLSAGNDRQTMTLNRIWSDPLYLIYVVSKGGSTGPIESIDDALDTALQGASGTATGGVIVKCWREGIFDEPQTLDGVTYQRLGGKYRILVRGL